MPEIEKRLKLTTIICGLLVAAEGLLVLFSWFVGWRLLTNISDEYIPMAPNSALMFLLMGSSVVAVSLAHVKKWFLWFARILLVSIMLFALIPIVEFFFDFDSGINYLIFQSYGVFQGVPEGYMSPLTALLLIASAKALLLTTMKNKESDLLRNTAASLGFGVILAGLVLCIGYLYGTPILYGETIVPVALSSSIAFVILGVGLVATAGAGSWLVDIVFGVDTRSRLLRVFIPIVTFALIVNGWIEIRFFDHRSANIVISEAFLVLIFSVLTSFMIFRFSRTIGSSIDDANERRLQVEKELRAERDFARNLIETSPSGIASVDIDGRIIFANRRAEEILCISKSTIEQRTYNDPEWKITGLDGRAISEEQLPFRMVIDSGAPVFDVRHAIEWPDGRRLLLSVNGAPVFNDEGKPAGMIAAIEDITIQAEFSRRVLREKIFADTIINSLPGIFYMFSEDSGMYRFNRNFIEISGYSEDELLGMEPLDFIVHEDRMLVGKSVMEVYSSGFSSVEARLLTKNDLAVPFYFTGYRLEMDDEVFLVGTGIDISRRVSAEDEIKREANKAQRYLDIAGVMLIDINVDETIRLINNKGCEILGYPQDQIIGQNWFYRFIPEPQREMVRKVFRQIMDGDVEPVEYFENLVINANGELRTVAWHNTLVRDESGRIISSFSSGEDITERKAAEKAIRESEERYHALFEASRDTIFISSPEGRFLDINPAGVKLFGYSSREEMLEIDIVSNLYIREEERDEYKELLVSQGFVHDYYAELKDRSGKRIIASITATAVRDDAGRITAYRGIIRDVTEQRNLQEQLIQAQKMEGIGRLAGGVAHDFNNFLTAIQGYTDLALTELPEDHPAYEDIVEARASSKRAADLTRQLLLFSRREAMNLKAVDMNRNISDLLGLLGRIIGEKYVIDMDLVEDIWITKADPAHMEQIIMNLVVNARDSMADGGRIQIRTRNVDVDAEHADRVTDARRGIFVRISVEDTGSGMDVKTIQHIFEPFFSTKKGKHGTGLGLSVAYGIIAEHGGWIEVDSEPGTGSSFNIYIPAVTDDSGITAVEDNKLYGDYSGHGERLLLVEDEASVRALAEMMLTRNGYNVTAANDANEAERMFDEADGAFDLLFSDVVLPGESGLSLAQRLVVAHPELPVVLASGYNEEVDQQTISRLGFRFLQKPYSIADLMAILRDQLEENHELRSE